MLELNKVHNLECLEGLKQLPDNYVDCCVTSPPYFGLRDYGVEGQIGLEETPEEYVAKLVDVFSEVKRVLKAEGTLWLNLGDSYISKPKSNYNGKGKSLNDKAYGTGDTTLGYKQSADKFKALLGAGNYKNKDLIGIPFMVAFALRADGWYLRQDIIWCLSGGTYLYVKTKNGVISPMMIRDMLRLNPKNVQLWNGEKWVNVLGWGESTDMSKKIEIELRSGERIQCTGKHKWVLENGEEKDAIDLKIGDVLKSARFQDECGHNPSMLTSDLLWLMGLWIAEGSLSNDCVQLALNKDESGWLNRIQFAIESVGGTITYTIDGNILNVRIYSQVFLAILHQYIGGKTAKNKHLNSVCWQMPNKNLKSIIDGYLDGDGHYDKKNNRIRLGFTRNYYWERDLRVLANRLGASITIKLSYSTCNGKKFPSFRGEWRWNVSEHFNNKKRNEIVAIRSGVGRNYYDISVDCDNHLFALASGVLTHNCKPNPMPEPVKDRLVKSHEYIFLMSKSAKYYFDYQAIQEVAVTTDELQRRVNNGNEIWKNNLAQGTYSVSGVGRDRREFYSKSEDGTYMRNKRDVWSVNLKPDTSAHFAVFPEDLIKPCILAGCPREGIVLDPFMGSGTTARVATMLNRNFIGFELNPEYVKICNNKSKVTGDLFY